MDKKIFAKILGLLFCVLILFELIFNYYASYRLFPIKFGETYGFISRSTGRVVVPLNKYNSRFISYLMVPFEYCLLKYYDRKLTKKFDSESKKYGFEDENGKLVIGYRYDSVQDFDKDYAIASVKKDRISKFGTIDKKGDWVIKPEYSYICSFKKYFTKACIDMNHCGVLDKFGNRITQMTYSVESIKCENCDRILQFCAIGSKNKNVNCNYFL